MIWPMGKSMVHADGSLETDFKYQPDKWFEETHRKIHGWSLENQLDSLSKEKQVQKACVQWTIELIPKMWLLRSFPIMNLSLSFPCETFIEEAENQTDMRRGQSNIMFWDYFASFGVKPSQLVGCLLLNETFPHCCVQGCSIFWLLYRPWHLKGKHVVNGMLDRFGCQGSSIQNPSKGIPSLQGDFMTNGKKTHIQTYGELMWLTSLVEASFHKISTV